MGFLELMLLAVGLSMDALAVSICKGLAMDRVTLGRMVLVGLWFGGFQGLMPLLGWLLGSRFSLYITAIDHWIAFALLPYVQEFNLIGNLERFAVIAKAMDLNVDGMSPFEAGEACVYGLKTFGRYLGIPQNLRSLGVDPADFEVMAENAMKDACAATNPRKATKDQIIAIFQKAYDGD